MKVLSAFAVAVGSAVLTVTAAAGGPEMWRVEWPNTDFAQHSVDFHEIMSGGPPKDGIPAIDAPQFVQVGDDSLELTAQEPVIAFEYDGQARAYPLRILMYHEIVNDVVAGLPVVITFCPLCNSSIVFESLVNGQRLDFGTTGKLRNSDLVMYDRQTESWWQQFTGAAIVGEMTGARLQMLPSRVVPFAQFENDNPLGQVLVPARPSGNYGTNPYAGYDGTDWPFLFRGEYSGSLAPLAYVLAVGDQAWSLDLLQSEERIETATMIINWQAGMNSALDSQWIPNGIDVGFVNVTDRNGAAIAHDMTFAFAFRAFYPDGVIHE